MTIFNQVSKTYTCLPLGFFWGGGYVVKQSVLSKCHSHIQYNTIMQIGQKKYIISIIKLF